MDKKIMKLWGVCLFAVASVGVLTACSDNDAENPEGVLGKRRFLPPYFVGLQQIN